MCAGSSSHMVVLLGFSSCVKAVETEKWRTLSTSSCHSGMVRGLRDLGVRMDTATFGFLWDCLPFLAGLLIASCKMGRACLVCLLLLSEDLIWSFMPGMIFYVAARYTVLRVHDPYSDHGNQTDIAHPLIESDRELQILFPEQVYTKLCQCDQCVGCPSSTCSL